MNQILLAAAILVLMVPPNNSSAQFPNDVANNYIPSPSDIMDSNTRVETKVTGINFKALRDFSRSYRNVNDAKWFITKNGYTASFDSKGINTQVIYDSRGWQLYSMLSYPENKLSPKIRHLVKSSYYDADIIGIHQFEFNNNKTVYVIKMLDKQSQPMTLKVYNGQIEDITSHAKK